MELTLAIYDNNGKIFTQITGDYEKPVGLQHIETTIPQGKVLVGVNAETHEPIFEDIPKSEVELLREQNKQLSDTVEMILVDILPVLMP
ncbi:MAG: hypothetical protein ABS882_04785 [Lysinibacillus sp.]